MKKKCSGCGEEKDLSEFNKSKGKKYGLQSLCKVCSRNRSREHYLKNKRDYRGRASNRRKKNKAFVNRVKSIGSCSKCGEDRHYVLSFHHTHSKKYNIHYMIKAGSSMESLKKEIRKCVLLCENCHREEHYLNKQ